MKIKVLDGAVLNPGDVDWAPLKALGELEVFAETMPGQLEKRVEEADIVLVNKTKIGAGDVDVLKKCKLVGVLATGANNLDLDRLRQAGIAACNVPAYGVEDVAQHALALLMELARHTGAHTRGVLAGEWQKRDSWCYWEKTPISLSGKTLGILGFGAIGQALGRMGHGLGMKILAYSRGQNAKTSYPFEYVSLPDLLKRSQALSLHCPLTPETRGIINRESISRMPDGAMIVNTARGQLVDEVAAAEALRSGKLAGLGTDVLSIEPPLPDNPLLKAPNVLITPHMAWATRGARQKIIDIMADNIRKFFHGIDSNIIN